MNRTNIRPTEISIGNYVMAPDGKGHYTPTRIVATSEDEIIDCYGNVLPIASLRPIILRKSVLVASGFKRTDNKHEMTIAIPHRNHKYRDVITCNFVHFDLTLTCYRALGRLCYTASQKVYSVHQFQQLLRAFSLDDSFVTIP